MKTVLLFLSLFVFNIIFCSSSFAFKFSPMSSTLGTKGSSTSSLYYLENDSDQPIAIQVSLSKREMDLNGVESNPKIEDELSMYPSQLIIPPNEKRSVKVTWLGKSTPLKEQAYRITAEQLPIELDNQKNKKASIKVLLRYVAALYVSAEEFSPDIKMVEMKFSNKKQISFLFENSGKKHQVLANLNLTFSNEKSKKNILLTPEELKGMSGENILAQSKRQFLFSKAGKFQDINPEDKVSISFDKD